MSRLRSGWVLEHFVVGLDIGGTAIKGALINAGGYIVCKEVIATCHDSGHERFVDSLCDLICKLSQGYRLDAVGLGIAGMLDVEQSMVLESPNMPQLQRLPLRKMLAQRLGCRVIIENDANAAAQGELRAGAGRGLANFLFFTLGTGIGSGLILNACLWRGEQGKAGEFGHVTVESDGELCGCGRRGCLEAYSSGTAIMRMARNAAFQHQDSALRAYTDNPSAITPEIVYQYALTGDAACCLIFKTMARGLAIAIANVNNLLDILCFIIGGGISGAFDLFSPMILEELDQRVFMMSRDSIRLIRAQLGNDAGVLGAGFLALDALDRG